MAIKHEDGKVTGSINLRKLFKKVKKALKNFLEKMRKQAVTASFYAGENNWKRT